MQGFWFGVIAVLWAGFFVLEGFDLGVGLVLPVVAGRDDQRRRMVLRSIGPVWDGNEVWLLVAGGATFAAFPAWYASMFSGFYLAFALLLVGLIVRGIGIEYREKARTPAGRAWCDAAFVGGSAIAALLLGVAFANLLRGVRMNAQHDMTSPFFSLLSPYALLGGLVTLSLFAFHGALFLALRTTGVVRDDARRLADVIAPLTGALAVALLVWTTQVRGGVVSWLLAALLAGTFVAGAVAARIGREGIAFAFSSVTALLVPIWLFACLWPKVLPARNNAAWSLTVHNASSTPYTLKVMTIVALVMTPIVLAYQAWTYWVFRARVTGSDVQGGGGYGDGPVPAVIARARASAAATLRRDGLDARRGSGP